MNLKKHQENLQRKMENSIAMIKSEQIVGAVHILHKFRKEIIKLIALVIIASIGVYLNSSYIIQILSKPLSNLPLFFLTPVEGIMIKMKIAVIGGGVICIPLIIYRIIFLLSDKISKKNRRFICFIIIPFVVVSFIVGGVFAYKFDLPTTVKFLLSCGDEFMNPTISGSSYFSFVIMFIVALGGVFELPLVLVGLSRIGIVKYKFLSSKRKIAILLIFIIAAIITPTPDAFSLIIVSLPMVVMYEISIWWIYLLERGERKRNVDSKIN